MSLRSSTGAHLSQNVERPAVGSRRTADLDLKMVDYVQSPRRGSYNVPVEKEPGDTSDREQSSPQPHLDACGYLVDKKFIFGYPSHRKGHLKTTIQGKVYNFLERPTGWKCFVYHFTVWVVKPIVLWLWLEVVLWIFSLFEYIWMNTKIL